ncbi:bifunctional DNA-formamidopyrimidine glycosylase/DNA-(apurinic or apyrimidinic site) lyase [Isoptericola sp. b441]|uniref:Bifunctional DNA-formamidopyrimidine glycosylase/DNA-(Apurinic or apyrimidinic site) lyase n=1 Tax=Actinotalea lenta TaxID=3064654 RepID=A0ABT9DCV6_9CELL|nr:bifunctional DNA-formamidopyrimidine glycosylase/DNA-(apurinic or apyrimidinic site) lyase [Isoptericola sp. b441]MDO8108159.1 bifunctional DNA-formamidopyrimidine glycosylase/DNA-(apurinic or apyrimidinic site) lyase [Isoptericola sp. b441]
MPELPEVETVRAGLDRHVAGRTVRSVRVLRDYSVRRHVGGSVDLAARLEGRTLGAVVRRGKYLWVLLDDDEALTAHLGMSGQLLVHHASDAPDHRHLRVRLELTTPGEPDRVLDFVDQRTFGHLAVAELVPTPDGGPGGRGSDLPALPPAVAHIARDVLDPDLDRDAAVAAVRRRHSEIKRALLDQTLVSGIGNIYADEALWRARLHGARPTDRLRTAQVRAVLAACEDVMRAALRSGGTSFDALYVDVNGSSGYFDRELAVYGRAGLPCPRCGAPVRREPFMNRSSFSCSACQPRPRPVRRVHSKPCVP